MAQEIEHTYVPDTAHIRSGWVYGSREIQIPEHVSGPQFDRWLWQHDAEVIREVARRIYNGAGDPEQEYYDVGVAHWLEQRAIRKELGLDDPES